MKYGRRKYKHIYATKHRRRSSNVLKIVITIIVLAALVFLGYCMFDPISKLIKGEYVPKPTSSESSSSEVSSEASSAVTEEETPEVTTEAVKGVYLTKNYLSDSTLLNQFITDAKANGINLAVIDIKGEDGIINYNTEIEGTKGTVIVAENAPDAKAAVKALSDAGITPAARICAFQDPVAPTVLQTAGVKYAGNHTINWIDSSNNRWLNPNSTDAQQYIINIASECVANGFKEIYVDGLTFPTTPNADSQSYYGDNMPSKEEVLSNFVTVLKTNVNSQDAKLTVMTSGPMSISQAQENIGQTQSIFSYSADNIAPVICPSTLGTSNVSINGTVVEKPDLDPTATVKAVAEYLKTSGGDKLSQTIPFIQAYTNTSLGESNYKEYTADDIKGEIASLKESSINSFILYNPDGQYDLTVVK